MASQLGWPKVENTRLWTSWTHMFLSMPKCSKMPYTATARLVAMIILKVVIVDFLSMNFNHAKKRMV